VNGRTSTPTSKPSRKSGPGATGTLRRLGAQRRWWFSLSSLPTAPSCHLAITAFVRASMPASRAACSALRPKRRAKAPSGVELINQWFYNPAYLAIMRTAPTPPSGFGRNVASTAPSWWPCTASLKREILRALVSSILATAASTHDRCKNTPNNLTHLWEKHAQYQSFSWMTMA
jgi:hypothetical protein